MLKGTLARDFDFWCFSFVFVFSSNNSLWLTDTRVKKAFSNIAFDLQREIRQSRLDSGVNGIVLRTAAPLTALTMDISVNDTGTLSRANQ
jgi:hypothetical protein